MEALKSRPAALETTLSLSKQHGEGKEFSVPLGWGCQDRVEEQVKHLPCPGHLVSRALRQPCGLIDMQLQVTLSPASQAAMMPLCACLDTHGRLCSTSEVVCSILCAVHVSDCGTGCVCYCDRQYSRISGCWRGLP